MAMAELLQHPHFVPFLEVFKDGEMIDSLRLEGRDSFMLGRHGLCDVFLAHPSISRHHLQIRVFHATREILLTDLDSVHGTWIDDKKLPPLKPTTVREGENIRLGASSRIYKLQWKLPGEQQSKNSSEKMDEIIIPCDPSQWLLDLSSSEYLSSCTESEGFQISENGTDDILSDTCNKEEDNEEASVTAMAQALEALSLQREEASTVDKTSKESPNTAQEGQFDSCISNPGKPSPRDQKTSKLPRPYLHHQNKDPQKLVPPLPPARRMPFAPLQSNVSKNAMGYAMKKVEGNVQQQSDISDAGRLTSDSNLSIRRCNSAPYPFHCSKQGGLTERGNNQASDMDCSKQSILTERRNDQASDVASSKQNALCKMNEEINTEKGRNNIEKENIVIKTIADGGSKAHIFLGKKESETESMTSTKNTVKGQISQVKKTSERKNIAIRSNKENVSQSQILSCKKDNEMENNGITDAFTRTQIIFGEKRNEKEDIARIANTAEVPRAQIMQVQDNIAIETDNREALTKPPIILGEKDSEKEIAAIIANSEEVPKDGIICIQENIAIKATNIQAATKSQFMLGDKVEATQFVSTSALDKLILVEEEEEEEEIYPSDKENQDPILVKDGREERLGVVLGRSASQGSQRIPFQLLPVGSSGVHQSSSPSPSCYRSSEEENTRPKAHQRKPSTVVQNLDDILQELKGLAREESHHGWHIVVDSTSLLDPASFKCLKLLEGIKEVRLIIPRIVIRELEVWKGKDRASMPSHIVLEWIESCMVKFPTWIHVQNSAENLPFKLTTSPVSPLYANLLSTSYGSRFNDLKLCPTNGDNVLNCALGFSNRVIDGQVVVLTNDRALRIKAMSEGLMCESATAFCESLWSPYSERFLWRGSVAHHSHRLPRAMSCSSPRRRSKEPGMVMSDVRGSSDWTKKKHHRIAEGLKNHCWKALGLKALLE